MTFFTPTRYPTLKPFRHLRLACLNFDSCRNRPWRMWHFNWERNSKSKLINSFSECHSPCSCIFSNLNLASSVMSIVSSFQMCFPTFPSTLASTSRRPPLTISTELFCRGMDPPQMRNWSQLLTWTTHWHWIRP